MANTGSFCVGATNTCPRVIMPLSANIPSGVGSINNYVSMGIGFETRVRLPEESPFPYYFAGLGLYSQSKVVAGVTGAFEVVIGFFRERGVTVACMMNPHQGEYITSSSTFRSRYRSRN